MRTFRYIFLDLIPVFILGILVFIFILLMFQALRLTEFMLVHGVPIGEILKLMSYLSISFLPAILPMSALFAVLMTYGRLSNDSEIIALKASGVHMFQIVMPALLFGLIVSVIAAKTLFELAPWGNRQFEVMVNRIGSQKAAISLHEGTFSEGFFDMVIYANKVDSTTGMLDKVFIYDDRRSSSPLTIIAKHGQILTDVAAPGHYALLRLRDGSIHKQSGSHTRIKFDSYDIELSDPVHIHEKAKTMQSLTFDEIQQRLKTPIKDKGEALKLSAESHKRMAISVACFVFAVVGAGFGCVTNKRSGKSGGFVLSIILIVFYWIFYVSMENAARQGQLPVAFAIWLPNALFFLTGIYKLRSNWN